MREWAGESKEKHRGSSEKEYNNNEQNKVGMGHGRPQRWPDPGRHPFIPAPFSLHCYSSGSVTVAERKILAGCPVKHERC